MVNLMYAYKPYENETTLRDTPGLNLDLHSANEKRRYRVTPSLIGWEQT